MNKNKSGKNPHRHLRKVTKRFISSITKEDGCYRIGEARLPALDLETERQFFGYVFEDIFYSYLNCGDNYDEGEMNRYYSLFIFIRNTVFLTVLPESRRW